MSNANFNRRGNFVSIGNCPRCNHYPTQFIGEPGNVKCYALSGMATVHLRRVLNELIATGNAQTSTRQEAIQYMGEFDNGPDVPDGHDHEGFPGGCERFGHTPETCPEAPGNQLAEEFQGLMEELVEDTLHCSTSVSGGTSRDPDQTLKARIEAFTVRLALAPVQQERIICAAIRCPDGTIIKGHRHHDCIRTAFMIPRFSDNSDGKLDKDQGFVTSTDRYVDRKEAADIAIASGQVKKLIAPPNLYSEDLY